MEYELLFNFETAEMIEVIPYCGKKFKTKTNKSNSVLNELAALSLAQGIEIIEISDFDEQFEKYRAAIAYHSRVYGCKAQKGGTCRNVWGCMVESELKELRLCKQCGQSVVIEDDLLTTRRKVQSGANVVLFGYLAREDVDLSVPVIPGLSDEK